MWHSITHIYTGVNDSILSISMKIYSLYICVRSAASLKFITALLICFCDLKFMLRKLPYFILIYALIIMVVAFASSFNSFSQSLKLTFIYVNFVAFIILTVFGSLLSKSSSSSSSNRLCMHTVGAYILLLVLFGIVFNLQARRCGN